MNDSTSQKSPQSSANEDPFPLVGGDAMDRLLVHDGLPKADRSGLAKETLSADFAAKLREAAASTFRGRLFSLRQRFASRFGAASESFGKLHPAPIGLAFASAILLFGAALWLTPSHSLLTPESPVIATTPVEKPADQQAEILLAGLDYDALLDLDWLLAEQESEQITQMEVF